MHLQSCPAADKRLTAAGQHAIRSLANAFAWNVTHSSVTMLRTRLVVFALIGIGAFARAQNGTTMDPRLYAGLTWRNLGPFRAGRVAAVSGAIGQPGVF